MSWPGPLVIKALESVPTVQGQIPKPEFAGYGLRVVATRYYHSALKAFFYSFLLLA